MVRRLPTVGALMAIAVAMLAMGCGSDSDDSGGSTGSTAAATQAAGGKTYTIGWVPPTVAPFEVAMRKGIQLQAAEHGMKFAVAGGQFDPKVQITAVDALLTRGIDALAIAPLDEKSIRPALDRAKAKNIPVLVLNAPDVGADVNFVTPDAQATEEQAKYVAQKIGQPCNVAILGGLEVVPTLKARNEGYAKGAEESGCKVLSKQINTDDSSQKAGDITRTWKTQFGSDLKAIFASTDPSAIAASAALGGDFEPAITGMNGDADVIDAIKQGRITSTQSYPAPEIGNAMAFAAWELLNGKQVPKTVTAPFSLVTADNVDDYKSYDDRTAAPMTVSFDGGVLKTQLGN